MSSGFSSSGFVSSGFVSSGFVSSGFVSSGFVSSGFVSSGSSSLGFSIITTSNVIVNSIYVISKVFVPTLVLSKPFTVINSDSKLNSSVELSLYVTFSFPPVKSKSSSFCIYIVLSGILLIEIPITVFSTTVIF